MGPTRGETGTSADQCVTIMGSNHVMRIVNVKVLFSLDFSILDILHTFASPE
jgi:hypothetical protein